MARVLLLVAIALAANALEVAQKLEQSGDDADWAPKALRTLVLTTEIPFLAKEDRTITLQAGMPLKRASADWCNMIGKYSAAPSFRDCYLQIFGTLCTQHILDSISSRRAQDLLQFVSQLLPMRYVQIGAYTAEDFLHRPEIRGSSGLLVEPVPFVFDRIRKHPDNVYENAAVCNTSGTVPFYTVHEDVDLTTGIDRRTGRYIHRYITQISSLSKAYFVRNFEELVPGVDVAEYIRELAVPCYSVHDLLAKYPAFDHPDVVVIDAEGFDYAILRQFNLVDPSVVVFEHAHLSQKEKAEALVYVHDAGLETFEEEENIVAIRRHVLLASCQMWAMEP